MKKHGKLLLKYLLLFVMTVFVMGVLVYPRQQKQDLSLRKGKPIT